LAIELNHFDSWEFMLLDPVHKFLWATFLVGNFSDLVIKKGAFGFLDYLLEFLPVF